MKKLRRLLSIVSLCIVNIVNPLQMLHAANGPKILSVALPDYLLADFPSNVFQRFEADHPGLTVNIVKSGNDVLYYPPAAAAIADHLAGAKKYTATADILYVDKYNLSVETSRAGYFMDLSPLVSGDRTLNAEDFVPAIWQSFQWDRGLWAMPLVGDVMVLCYNPTAFEKAKIAAPSEKWTLNDLTNSMRVLKARTGTPPLFGLEQDVLFRSLLGEGLYDSSSWPNPPNLTSQNAEALIDTWAKLQAENLTSIQGNPSTYPLQVSRSACLDE